jgi:hypothetical protein
MGYDLHLNLVVSLLSYAVRNLTKNGELNPDL